MTKYTNYLKEWRKEKLQCQDINEDLKEAALDLYGEPTIYN